MFESQDKICIVITTVSSASDARKISSLLVENKLAACVQIEDVTSFFVFENKMNEAIEYRLFIKSISSKYKQIERLILDNHSYDLPQVIEVPISQSYGPYAEWIKKNTAGL